MDNRVSKLLYVELLNNISKLQSNITMKWPAGHVSQEKRKSHSLCICYLKVIEGQVSLSTLLCTPRVCVDSLFFGYFDGLEKSTKFSVVALLSHMKDQRMQFTASRYLLFQSYKGIYTKSEGH